jgi:hypothetical protein
MSLTIGTISDVHPILGWMLVCDVFDDGKNAQSYIGF